jgi:hypothetical protein
MEIGKNTNFDDIANYFASRDDPRSDRYLGDHHVA